MTYDPGTPHRPKRTLGQIIAFLKYQSTQRINVMHDSPGVPLWQRNYYERIIRDEEELNRTRDYIRGNPVHWATDENNLFKEALFS